MKYPTFIAIGAMILLAACASPQTIANNSKRQCNMMGYAQNDTRHTECTERGFRTQTAIQQRAQSDVATYLILDMLF